jgi:hypothetical protein
MDEWLKNAPALLYGNNTWLVVNKWCDPLSWTEDAAEAAWLLAVAEAISACYSRKWEQHPGGAPPCPPF